MRAREILTETVEEQQNIVTMAKNIIKWHSEKIGDMSSLLKNRNNIFSQLYNESEDGISDDELLSIRNRARDKVKKPGIDDIDISDDELLAIMNRGKMAKFDYDNWLNRPIRLVDVVGSGPWTPTVNNWLSTNPTIIFATEVNPSLEIRKIALQRFQGWWNPKLNHIVINCTNQRAVYSHLSTIVHELQHGLDYYKSNSLIGQSSLAGRGGSTTRAKQEKEDISTIIATFKNAIDRIPSSGLYIKDIITSDSLQSTIFKNLVNDPEIASMKIESPGGEYSDEMQADRYLDLDIDNKSGTYLMFYWVIEALLTGSTKYFLTKLENTLNEYRNSYYKPRAGYSNAVKQGSLELDKNRSEYLSKNHEINARISQAFHAIIERLTQQNFKGYSKNKKTAELQQKEISNVVNAVYSSYHINGSLFPERIREERLRRLQRRLQQYILAHFPENSNIIPKAIIPRRNDDVRKLLSLLGPEGLKNIK